MHNVWYKTEAGIWVNNSSHELLEDAVILALALKNGGKEVKVISPTVNDP